MTATDRQPLGVLGPTLAAFEGDQAKSRGHLGPTLATFEADVGHLRMKDNERRSEMFNAAKTAYRAQ